MDQYCHHNIPISIILVLFKTLTVSFLVLFSNCLFDRPVSYVSFKAHSQTIPKIRYICCRTCYNSASTERIDILLKSLGQIQVWLNSDKNSSNFTRKATQICQQIIQQRHCALCQVRVKTEGSDDIPKITIETVSSVKNKLKPNRQLTIETTIQQHRL